MKNSQFSTLNSQFKKNSPLVLLVEDDLTLLDLNKKVLEREGCRVLSARNLLEAREKVKQGGISAVVLDLELPDGSGLDFCRELRKDGSTHEKIPILILTALADENDEQAGYAAGADDYITKPYRIERLTKGIEKLIETVLKEEQP